MSNKRDSQQMQATLPDIDEAFRARVNQVFDNWIATTIEYDAAIMQLNTLREEAKSSTNPVNEACIDNILGVIHGYRSNFEESIQHFTIALELFTRYGALRRVASCRLNIGENYRLLGNFARAQSNFQETYQIARNLNDLELQAIAISNEGLMVMNLGNYQRAKTILESALKLILEEWHPEDPRFALNRIDNLCEIYDALAQIHLEEKHYPQALNAAKSSLTLAHENGRPFRIGYANRSLGTVMSKLKYTPDESMSSDPDFYYQASLDAFKQVNAESEWAKTLFAQGQSLVERGKKQQAGQNFQQAIQIFNKLSMWQEAAQVMEAQLGLL